MPSHEEFAVRMTAGDAKEGEHLLSPYSRIPWMPLRISELQRLKSGRVMARLASLKNAWVPVEAHYRPPGRGAKWSQPSAVWTRDGVTLRLRRSPEDRAEDDAR